MKILLVEDDKGIARFVKKGLSENSYAVDVAFDGEEGLDLSIAEWIVRPHQGSVEVRSELNRGSIFTAYLVTPRN